MVCEFIENTWGIPIYIATQSHQIRKHRKKRINKKWFKKYGCHEIDLIPNGEVVMDNGAIWMNKKTWEQLKGN